MFIGCNETAILNTSLKSFLFGIFRIAQCKKDDINVNLSDTRTVKRRPSPEMLSTDNEKYVFVVSSWTLSPKWDGLAFAFVRIVQLPSSVMELPAQHML